MQRIKFLLFVLSWSFAFCVQAQDDDKPSYYQRPSNPKPAPTAPAQQPASQQKNSNPKAYAYTQKKFDMERILIEPTIQLFFSGQQVTFGLKPTVVYDIWKKKLFVGGGIDYNLNAIFRYPVGNTTKTVTVQSFGGGPVLHYNIWKGLYARIQPEVLGVRIPYSYTHVGINNVKVQYKTYAYPYMWLGAGWNLARGMKGIFMPAGIYFDPIYFVRSDPQRLSPYGPVYFQIGIYILDPLGIRI